MYKRLSYVAVRASAGWVSGCLFNEYLTYARFGHVCSRSRQGESLGLPPSPPRELINTLRHRAGVRAAGAACGSLSQLPTGRGPGAASHLLYREGPGVFSQSSRSDASTFSPWMKKLGSSWTTQGKADWRALSVHAGTALIPSHTTGTAGPSWILSLTQCKCRGSCHTSYIKKVKFK